MGAHGEAEAVHGLFIFCSVGLYRNAGFVYFKPSNTKALKILAVLSIFTQVDRKCDLQSLSVTVNTLCSAPYVAKTKSEKTNYWESENARSLIAVC